MWASSSHWQINAQIHQPLNSKSLYYVWNLPLPYFYHHLTGANFPFWLVLWYCCGGEAHHRNTNIIIKTVISGRKPLIFINNHKKKLLVANSELQIVIFNLNGALSTNCCHLYFEVAIASWSLLTLRCVKNKSV